MTTAATAGFTMSDAVDVVIVDVPIMTRPSESNTLQTRDIDRPLDDCVITNSNEHVDNESMRIPNELELRRHSSQGDRPCEIFQRQISNHMREHTPPLTTATQLIPSEKITSNSRQWNRNALNWLKNFNLMRVNPLSRASSPLLQQLHRCSSENVLLLSPEHRSYDLTGTPGMRKSFSSGILF